MARKLWIPFQGGFLILENIKNGDEIHALNLTLKKHDKEINVKIDANFMPVIGDWLLYGDAPKINKSANNRGNYD